ncbi:hypothetical protein [Streptomyces sp. NPDC002889]|uniref:hypothetical protein n=1 Tax=Streptomyces sp. NPDC002889 TaxID=3364669 RepID=UPI0036CB3241
MNGECSSIADCSPTMCRTRGVRSSTVAGSCGSATLPEFRSTARLTLVSDQSFQESHANVTLRDTPTTVS